MAKLKITTLDQLEKLVLDPKINKKDKFNVFTRALENYPIMFIKIIADESEVLNGIEDNENTLIPKMIAIISEIKKNPTSKHFAGMTVIMSDSQNVKPPDIDYRN